jgi:hypothetical protein
MRSVRAAMRIPGSPLSIVICGASTLADAELVVMEK